MRSLSVSFRRLLHWRRQLEVYSSVLETRPVFLRVAPGLVLKGRGVFRRKLPLRRSWLGR